jgi:hypothetical protein
MDRVKTTDLHLISQIYSSRNDNTNFPDAEIEDR